MLPTSASIYTSEKLEQLGVGFEGKVYLVFTSFFFFYFSYDYILFSRVFSFFKAWPTGLLPPNLSSQLRCILNLTMWFPDSIWELLPLDWGLKVLKNFITKLLNLSLLLNKAKLFLNNSKEWLRKWKTHSAGKYFDFTSFFFLLIFILQRYILIWRIFF